MESLAMREYKLAYLDPGALLHRSRNPRTHTPKQIRQIANSIKEFGFTNPVLIDAEFRIVAGHGRVAAAKLLGLTSIPTICLPDLPPEKLRAYVIADNRLAELAGWDAAILKTEFDGLLLADPDFDLSVTGFEMAEIDGLLQEVKPSSLEDHLPGVEADAITQPGDLWLLGHHRLLCADATKEDSYSRLLQGRQAQVVFTDPPYNVPIAGHVGGLGKVQHAEFAMASGEMTSAQFTSFLSTVLNLLAINSVNGAIHFICMDWRHLPELLAAGRAYTELKNICVWNKTNGGMGSLYRSKHELVLVYKSGTAPHVNNVELGRHGRYRTNVWDYAGANALGGERDAELAMHPTVKPVGLVADALLDCSKRGGIVLDAFTGSGSTLIAAQRTGRRCYGLELEPKYVDTIIRRFEAYTGLQARHAERGRSFDETAADRQTEGSHD